VDGATVVKRRRRPRIVVTAILAAVAAALVLPGCDPPDTPRARSGRCQVGIVGDSLTVGMVTYGDVEAQLAAAGCATTAVDGVVSRLTHAGATIVEGWAADDALPAILVVELGTNDCTASVFERHARRILVAAGPDRPIVWINTWNPRCDAAINAVIADLQAEGSVRSDGGRLWIVDHRGWIAANRHLLSSDGLHLTAEGYRAYAQRLVEALGPPTWPSATVPPAVCCATPRR
jgi:lysophospholipase L1-like esterase